MQQPWLVHAPGRQNVKSEISMEHAMEAREYVRRLGIPRSRGFESLLQWIGLMKSPTSRIWVIRCPMEK